MRVRCCEWDRFLGCAGTVCSADRVQGEFAWMRSSRGCAGPLDPNSDSAEFTLADSAGRVVGCGTDSAPTTLTGVDCGWRRRAEPLLLEIGAHLQIGIN